MQPMAGEAGAPVLGADARITARWWLDVAPLLHLAQVRARAEVAKAQEEAAALVEAARAEAEALRAQAQEEGRQAGLAAGRAEGEAEVRAQVEPLLAALRRALEEAAAAAAAASRRDEEDMVRLALAIAARLSRQPEIVGPDAVHRVLEEELPRAAGLPMVTIRLHPADLEALQEVTGELARRLDGGTEVVWVADDRLQRGGCLIETDRGHLDARVETRLDRIAEELAEVVRVAG